MFGGFVLLQATGKCGIAQLIGKALTQCFTSSVYSKVRMTDEIVINKLMTILNIRNDSYLGLSDNLK